MADLIITTGVMPISAVVLLSGEWDVVPVCQMLQFLTAASTYCYSLFFAVSTFHNISVVLLTVANLMFIIRVLSFYEFI